MVVPSLPHLSPSLSRLQNMGSGHTLNRIGERGSPCLTPWLILICLVSPFAVAKVVIATLYRSSTTLMNWVGTPNLMSPFTNRSCEMVSKAFAGSRNATARVPFSFFCFHIRCSGRTEFCLTPGAGMKPHCEGWRLTALVSLFASIFIYSLKSTLLIDSGRQLPVFSMSVVPFGRSKDLLAFSFSGTLPVISHSMYTPARKPGISSAFRLSLSTVIRSGFAAEPVLIALTTFLTSFAVTASRIRSQLGSACLVWPL